MFTERELDIIMLEIREEHDRLYRDYIRDLVGSRGRNGDRQVQLGANDQENNIDNELGELLQQR